MREILFRGKLLDTGEWVEGWYMMYCFGRWPLSPCIIPSQLAIDGEIRHCRVDPATVGQYIGQPDKNGKRIFEGDILRITDRYGKFLDWRVEFRKGAFSIKHPDCNYWCGIGDFDGYIIEVIGNVHDNPERREV